MNILGVYLIIGLFVAAVTIVVLEAHERSTSFSAFGETVALAIVMWLFWLPILFVAWVVKPVVEGTFK